MATSPNADPGAGGGLHEVFRRQAAATPSRIAVEYGEESLTYQELDRRSDRLASHLADGGSGPGEVIGLSFPRGIDMVVAVLGILKAGAAYLPIDADHPARRVAHIVEHSGVRRIVADPGLAGAFDRPGLTVTAYTSDAFDSEVSPGWAPVPVPPGAPAYVIYTSGTTGAPHGVVVGHGNVDRLFRETEVWFGFSADDVWTLFHSIAFDFSVWELWGALRYGGKVVVVPAATARTPERFFDLVADKGVTVLSQTPTAFRAFDAVDARRGADLALRHVVLGGEALDKESAAAWLARRGDTRPRLVNMYGITETTVHVTYRPLTAELLAASEHSPIGVPIPDLTVHLRDESGRPVPHGEVGEIHVSGPGVAAGYLHDAELTAARFTRSDSGEVTYRTGDLGVTADGVEYFYVGRADTQIKLHGYRIDPREAETIADAEPDLSGSVVLKVSPPSSEPHLVLFSLCRNGATPERRQRVLARIRESLPAYACPAQCVLLAEHPRNHHGKVDHDALREIYLAQPRSPRPDLADGHAETVRAIWEQVLGRPVTSSRTDFFEGGGTSLDLIRIMQETQKQLSVEVDLGAFADGLSLDVYVDHVGAQCAARNRS
ncbi:non-ribosomal peptide synthetase [Amycolatopsis sp. SID8362]|uniref:non-ribosomal peptide synthetase n=1 Tax=Amycolatopsis sp. SID8362 TaxID=2690346 RepID=UPI00136E8A92|nr:non-ribosomal peptide synthetase [Amycolatopsis sp. SID8362]NBH04610.1 amino acid adenylation domain-containing protein [Amycolatopsis sp. SID8362]NED41309.1 amino acid adenylation domain-containing protein [Amycolatopsis sp. SID8362]